ncbi:hypothetical protein RFI_23169 [Reticulomyxa filosa]|uniref:Uncharacterized protein n=1 Tax=Reticulomyxa filosa TaxID=46433 RepID=X6MM86_RETFI|nr:hypothetical protein RFI_23169 [Reticulomyxa filosa]|eukprot:ETO14200.1 hypothetical protein RFI_23169 [Reticulomyxa filosa]
MIQEDPVIDEKLSWHNASPYLFCNSVQCLPKELTSIELYPGDVLLLDKNTAPQDPTTEEKPKSHYFSLCKSYSIHWGIDKFPVANPLDWISLPNPFQHSHYLLASQDATSIRRAEYRKLVSDTLMNHNSLFREQSQDVVQSILEFVCVDLDLLSVIATIKYYSFAWRMYTIPYFESQDTAKKWLQSICKRDTGKQYLLKHFINHPKDTTVHVLKPDECYFEVSLLLSKYDIVMEKINTTRETDYVRWLKPNQDRSPIVSVPHNERFERIYTEPTQCLFESGEHLADILQCNDSGGSLWFELKDAVRVGGSFQAGKSRHWFQLHAPQITSDDVLPKKSLAMYGNMIVKQLTTLFKIASVEKETGGCFVLARSVKIKLGTANYKKLTDTLSVSSKSY